MFEQSIFQDLAPELRAEAMAKTAIRREEINYTHRYTDDELAKKRETLADVVTELIDLEEEKTELMQSINTRKKDKEGVRNTLVEQIRRKCEERFEGCWKYPDYEARRVAYYDRFGILVYERDMTPNEHQREMQFNGEEENADNAEQKALAPHDDQDITDVEFEEVADEQNADSTDEQQEEVNE